MKNILMVFLMVFLTAPLLSQEELKQSKCEVVSSGIQPQKMTRKDIIAGIEAAIKTRDIKALEALRAIAEGSEINEPLPNYGGKTALHYASINSAWWPDVILKNMLNAFLEWPKLDLKPLTNEPAFLPVDKLSPTNLFGLLAFEGDFEVIKLLLEAGIDPNFKQKNAISPLMAAAMTKGNNSAIIKELLKHGADMYDEWQYSENERMFVPMGALNHGANFFNIEPFIDAGFDINKRTSTGHSFREQLSQYPALLGMIQYKFNMLFDVAKQFYSHEQLKPGVECLFPKIPGIPQIVTEYIFGEREPLKSPNVCEFRSQYTELTAQRPQSDRIQLDIAPVSQIVQPVSLLEKIEGAIEDKDVKTIAAIALSEDINENSILPKSKKSILQATIEKRDKALFDAIFKLFSIDIHQPHTIGNVRIGRKYMVTDMLGKFAFENNLPMVQGLIDVGFPVHWIKEKPELAEDQGITHSPMQAAEKAQERGTDTSAIIKLLKAHGAQ